MKKCKNVMNKIMLLLGMFFLGVMISPKQTVFAAATPVTIKKVAYGDEYIYVNNNGNERIYFATEVEAAKDNWEVMLADSGTTTVIDMSWLSPSVENIIKIKGDGNQTQTRVILRERTRKLEVSFNYSKIGQLLPTDTIAPLVNVMTTEGTADNPVDFTDLEWKKGTGGQWYNTDDLTYHVFQKLLIKGTYLYFRIKPVDDITVGTDYADGTDGRRYGSEVKVKISKKSSPMVVGIDGEDFTAEIKYSKEYRVTAPYGGVVKTTDWIPVIDRAVKKLPLSTIVNNGSDGTTATKAFPEMIIEIRNYATAKTAASKITEIYIDAQRVIAGPIIQGDAPEDATAADDNVYISYNGIKNMVITIPSATPAEPFEYCVVKPGDFFELERAIWTSVTKGTEVKILASKAVEGGILYVRQKEIKSKEATRTTAAVSYALASTYVTHSINYPSIPEIPKTSYTFVKGYSDSITFSVKLNVIGKKAFETQIKNIKLGTREIGFSYTVSTDGNLVSTMNITLNKTSLESMTNSYNRAITINFEKGTVDKTSIKLTIKSPTPAYSLTATAAKGTVAGNTAITVVSSVGAGNSMVYIIGATAVTNANTEDTMLTGTAFISGANIGVTAGQYITVYEINTTTKNIVKFKSIEITAELIQ